MSKNKREEHLEFIDTCIRNKSGIAWTRKKFVNKLKIPIRTFQSYLKELKDRGAKIKYNRTSGYSYEAPFIYKKPLISKEDADKIYSAISILKELDIPSQYFDLESVIIKLENASQIDAQANNTIVQFEHHSSLKGLKEYFDILYSAIKDEKVLAINYKKFYTEKVNTHIFHPYLLKEYHNLWYLFGKIDGKENITTLALDRIEAIKPTDFIYKWDKNFDPDNYFKNAIGITFEGVVKPEEVLIRVTKKQAPYFINQPLHSSQKKVKEFKNGDTLFSLFIVDNIELKMMLMQYANTLKVIQPESLQKSINEMIKSAVKINLK